MHVAHDIEIGSQAMVAKGIYARVVVNLWSSRPQEGGVRVCSGHDMRLLFDQTKQQWWIGMPRREYQANDPNNPGQKITRHQQLIWMFPGNRAEYDRWVGQVYDDYTAKLREKGFVDGEGNPTVGAADPNYGADRQAAQAERANAPAAPAAPPIPAVPAAPVVAAPVDPVPVAPAVPVAPVAQPTVPVSPGPVVPAAPPAAPAAPPAPARPMPPPASPTGGFPR